MTIGQTSFDQAIALYRGGQLGSARAALLAVIERQPNHAMALTALGYVQRDIGDLGSAAAAFDAALRLGAAGQIALPGRARIALERGEPSTLDLYEAALAAKPNDPGLLLEQTEARVELGDLSAIDDLADRVDRSPNWTDGLITLAGMRRESLGDEHFDRPIRQALAQEPKRLDLWRGLIDLLSRVDRFKAAAETCRAARSAVGDLPEFVLAEAVNASCAGETERARALFADLVSDEPMVSIPRALHRLRTGDLEAARDDIDAALAQDPSLIGAWGIAELVYRALDDPRAEWLAGQDGLIRTFDLGLDPQLVRDATELLRSLHVNGVQVAGQSVRDGTQTRWRLFDRREPELARLKQAMEAAVADYVAALPPTDDRHPLLRHRNSALRITGSWSVRLTGTGRHVSHTHPLGLIGSASYLVVPETATGGELELGRPPEDLGLALDPIQVITPKPGRLVLFPSYLHHGTRQFESGERLSVAFDVALDPAAF